MELGEKLKQARLEAGLSQRQLCGDTITRNMLSQIENGTAKPSLATLQALCLRLGKPVSYFWEDAPSENLSLLYKAARTEPREALALLQGYLAPDPMLDEGYFLLSARCCLLLAEQAIGENRMGYAQSLLEQADKWGERCPSFENLYRRRWILLSHRAGISGTALPKLPDNTEEMLIRAKAALENKDPEKCLACLTAADRQTENVLLLMGDAFMEKKDYPRAISCYVPLEQAGQTEVYARLEICYREQGDFQKAYEYACKQR